MSYRRTAMELIGLIRRVTDCPVLGAEIGVDKGYTSAPLLVEFPQLRLICVDAWDESLALYSSGTKTPTREGTAWARQRFDTVIRKVRDRCIVLPMMSHLASREVPDGVLDFCFIDADHHYEATKQDIELWYPKVRPGGLFCGHDYKDRRNKDGVFGVTKAVNEFAAAAGLKLFSTRQSRMWYVFKPGNDNA